MDNVKMKSGLVLAEGEQLVMELEAELWAESQNPVAQFFGAIRRIFAMILGFRHKGFVVITNQRVVEIYNAISCYVFNTSRQMKCLLPSSIKEVGYFKTATCGFFCPSYKLYYESFTQRTSIQLSAMSDGEAQKVVDAFYNAIAKAQ